MENKERLMRPTDEQLALFKNVFSENKEFLKTIRKVFLHLPLNEGEKDSLTYIIGENEKLQKALRLMFLPELDGDMPLGQNMDLWMTLDLADKAPSYVSLMLQSRALLIEFIEAGLKELLAPVEDDKFFSFKPTGDEEADFIQLTARNTFVGHVDQVLNQIKFLSGRREETVDETKRRLAKDSSK